MGGEKSKQQSNLEENPQLVNIISSYLETKKSDDKINKLLKKGIKNEIKKSNFKKNFLSNNNGFKNSVSLLDLIYLNATNTYLKEKENITLYQSIFNYDIIEFNNNKKEYDYNNAKIANLIKNIITNNKKKMKI